MPRSSKPFEKPGPIKTSTYHSREFVPSKPADAKELSRINELIAKGMAEIVDYAKEFSQKLGHWVVFMQWTEEKLVTEDELDEIEAAENPVPEPYFDLEDREALKEMEPETGE